jgi:hypothetical protein
MTLYLGYNSGDQFDGAVVIFAGQGDPRYRGLSCFLRSSRPVSVALGTTRRIRCPRRLHSRHCLWLMLAVSLSHSISGVAVAGQIRTVLSYQAAAVEAKRHTEHRVSVARERPPMGWPVSAFHNRTVLASFALCLPRPLEVDSFRTELVGPTSSFVALGTELATNASARSLHKHSHAAQVGLGRASDMSERRTRRAEQEVDDLLGDDLAR